MQLWTDADIIEIDGKKYLNQKASMRFFDAYRDRLGLMVTRGQQFGYEWAKNAVAKEPLTEARIQSVIVGAFSDYKDEIISQNGAEWVLKHENAILYDFLNIRLLRILGGTHLTPHEIEVYGKLLNNDFSMDEYQVYTKDDFDRRSSKKGQDDSETPYNYKLSFDILVDSLSLIYADDLEATFDMYKDKYEGSKFKLFQEEFARLVAKELLAVEIDNGLNSNVKKLSRDVNFIMSQGEGQTLVDTLSLRNSKVLELFKKVEHMESLDDLYTYMSNPDVCDEETVEDFSRLFHVPLDKINANDDKDANAEPLLIEPEPDEEDLEIVSRRKPLTEEDRKKRKYAIIAGVGVISCIFMTFVLKLNPVNVISRCVSTFTNLLSGKAVFAEFLAKLVSLPVYFGSIVASIIGGSKLKKMYDEGNENVSDTEVNDFVVNLEDVNENVSNTEANDSDVTFEGDPHENVAPKEEIDIEDDLNGDNVEFDDSDEIDISDQFTKVMR